MFAEAETQKSSTQLFTDQLERVPLLVVANAPRPLV
jgi:hypothetical protein